MKQRTKASGSNRKYPRIPADLQCAISRTGDADPKTLRGKVRSLGLGGLAIETGVPLTVGESIQVVFSVDGQRIEAQARVIFVQGAPSGFHESGIQFTRIHHEYRDSLLASMLLKEYRLGEL